MRKVSRFHQFNGFNKEGRMLGFLQANIFNLLVLLKAFGFQGEISREKHPPSRNRLKWKPILARFGIFLYMGWRLSDVGHKNYFAISYQILKICLAPRLLLIILT